MSLTLSALITLAIAGIIVVRARDAKSLFFASLTVLVTMNANSITAAAFSIGSQEVNCDDLILVVCLLSAISLLVKGIKVSKRQVAITLTLLAAIAIGFIWTLQIDSSIRIITPDQSWDSYYYGLEVPGHISLGLRSALILFRLTAFCLLILVAQSVLDRQKVVHMAGIVLLFGSAHVAYALVEYVDKAILHTNVTVTISQALFNPVFSTSTVRGDMTTIWGFTREPSHFAYAMFFTALVCALLSAARPINKREMLTGIFATVLMLISGAFSSILLGIGLVAFFACSMVRKSKSTFNGRVDIRLSIALVGAVIAAALVGLYMLGGDSFYASKLANVIDNLPALIGQNYTQLQGTADAMPRMISIVDTFYLFLQYPLFGAGLGTVNPFSAVTGVLSNVGLIGFALWLSLLFDYARTFSGPNSARFIVLLLVAVGALNMDTGLMYSPVWLLLGGLFWSSSRMFGHHHQHSYASARTPVPLVAHKGASE